MIIGIDGNEANVQHLVGVSIYTLSILNQFQQRANEDISCIIYLKHPPLKHMPPETQWFRYEIVPGPVLWSRIFFPLHLALHDNIDVLFCPGHYSPPLYRGPLVVTIHDLAYYAYPEEFLKKDLYKLIHWTAASIRKARTIIAVSDMTRQDIVRHFPTAKDKVKVIHNGYTQPTQLPDTNVLTKLQVVKHKYLLFVGTLQPRKNVLTLIEAYKLLLDQHQELRLVIVGKKGWLYESIIARAQELNISDMVIFTGYIPENDLQTLYRNALCYINPSFYEGFGIPILEAMSHGCPVIASQTASLPEVGGDACLYIDPDTPLDIVTHVQKLLNDTELRKKQITLGYERSKTFSWVQSAEQTLSVLQQSLHGSPQHQRHLNR